MIEIHKKSDCCGCEACANVCPKSCIVMEADEQGFYYPIVYKRNCIQCGKCEKVCPIINVPSRDEKNNLVYASTSTDLKSKLQSSSGGIFYLLANDIIKRGGCVFGTRFDDTYRCAEVGFAEKIDELKPYLGSKYIQSRIWTSYQVVKDKLKAGKEVLFCGTPCQIAGLHNYLQCEYPNLYTVDFVCHGVPSEKIWHRYLDQFQDQKETAITMAAHRTKSHGWKSNYLEVVFDNGIIISEEFRISSFGRAFNSRIIFRPSCEHCKFKGMDRISDLTLGDFWGIGEYLPEMDDDKGVSLVIVHTDKGIELFNGISTQAISHKVNEEIATRRNPYLKYSLIPHRNKRKFFAHLDEMEFDALVSKYAIKEFVLKEFIRKTTSYIKRKV